MGFETDLLREINKLKQEVQALRDENKALRRRLSEADRTGTFRYYHKEVSH